MHFCIPSGFGIKLVINDKDIFPTLMIIMSIYYYKEIFFFLKQSFSGPLTLNLYQLGAQCQPLPGLNPAFTCCSDGPVCCAGF